MPSANRGSSEYGLKKSLFAKTIAEDHYKVDSSVTEIYRIVGPAEDDIGDPIKLLEVDADTVPTGIVPLYVGRFDWNWSDNGESFRLDHADDARDAELPIPIVVVEVSPDELEQVKRGELTLQDGWSLGPKFERPALLSAN
jgi:hypothetical protein